MKWVTKRAELISNEKMYAALSKVLVDFICTLQSEQKVSLWYTSLKNDDGRPSFRIYLQVADQDEESIRSEFQTFMEENKTELGWTGQFIQPDPGVPDSELRVDEIKKACELIQEVTKRFPESDRRQNHTFWSEIKAQYIVVVPSVADEHRPEFFHFLANNLFMPDEIFYNRLREA